MRLNIKKIIFLISIFLFSYMVFAREVTIIVTDADLHLPLEGAVVRSRDSGEFICGSDGKAVITVPDDRQVIFQAAYPGYETGIVTVTVTGSTFTVALRLSGHMMGRELVVEASKPGSTETRTGRSVAVSSREITQTGEIGIIEDVMSTISLLPGVSYKGFLDAEPSIRGGHPGDMSASLNGFYINNPFFWGGTFSIFDPRMVDSAQLSHGVFSARYGHTISGLLEITSRNPSPTQTQFEFSVNTSAANFNLSIPILGKGGLIFMGRITYYDPVLALASSLSGLIPQLELVSSFIPVPHIRTVTANGNYRFTDKLELKSTGFFGLDGVGAKFNNSSFVNEMLDSETKLDFLFKNIQTFFTSTLAWNPRSDMLLKFLIGTGFEKQYNLGDIQFNIKEKYFSKNFQNTYGPLYELIKDQQPYSFVDSGLIDQSESNLNIQGRIDYDWKFAEKFLLSAGIQALYNRFSAVGTQQLTNDILYSVISNPDVKQEVYNRIRNKYYDNYYNQIKDNYPFLSDEELNTMFDEMINKFVIAMPITYPPNPSNNLLTTSAYILSEYHSGKWFSAELGVRLDHFLLIGENDFRLDSDPVINPRLNLEFNILNNVGIFQKIDLSLGTGLFSSINNNVFFAEKGYNIKKIKPNRSWTSILGIKFDFQESISLNIEGYFKYIFDRMYIVLETNINGYDIMPKFDGEGMVGGIDVMLQKIQSRYWDGWLSYSFSWAKYRDPHGRTNGEGRSGGDRGDDWYFPSFHRFHTLNLVFNVKPIPSMNIYFRLGVASGVMLAKRSKDGPINYPVFLYNEDEDKDNIFIEKYYWGSSYDETNRTTPSLNLDIKFSIFGSRKNGRTRYELYFAVENVLGLVYTAKGNTSFNQYTGELEKGTFAATYDIPIPIPSFGFKMSY